ncbi:hypothetical protein PMAYCL1PPCAC_08420, partial [Pristionchus mayeri]
HPVNLHSFPSASSPPCVPVLYFGPATAMASWSTVPANAPSHSLGQTARTSWLSPVSTAVAKRLEPTAVSETQTALLILYCAEEGPAGVYLSGSKQSHPVPP